MTLCQKAYQNRIALSETMLLALNNAKLATSHILKRTDSEREVGVSRNLPIQSLEENEVHDRRLTISDWAYREAFIFS